MNEQIIHRGPDSDGFFSEEGFSMAMRRLAIIDLSTGGQPIYNSDSTLCIVFNGEIYNFRELRKELKDRGVVFKTEGDTEVILLGYEVYGDAIFSKLMGMFGISIYDRKKHEITLVRDRLGIKPIYYYSTSGDFVYGSEIKSILQHPSYEKKMDADSLNSLLRYKYIQGDGSMFEGITKLRPGYLMKVNFALEITRNEPYWKLEDHIEKPRITTLSESKKVVEEAIYRAVERRLIADVPLGVFLSGGIDSAILANVATELKGDRISTYSIGFDAKSYNELEYAKLSAEFNGTDHHALVVKPINIMELIDNLVRYIDEPLGDYAIIPNYLVSEFAEKDVKVALSGAGADEIFGGYERYWLNKGSEVFDQTPQMVIDAMIQVSRFLPNSSNKKSFKRRVLKFLESAKQPLGERYDRSFHMLTDSERTLLLSEEMNQKIGKNTEITVEQVFDTFPSQSFLTKASYADLKTILPNNYLIKEDRMSMARSLEVRVPFLDHELIETSYRIRDEFKMKGLTTKYILKEIFKNRIHKDILNRPKHGFEAPLRIWLREELRSQVIELFGNSTLVKNRILNGDRLDLIVKQHFANTHDHSKLLFTLISLELWNRQHFPNGHSN